MKHPDIGGSFEGTGVGGYHEHVHGKTMKHEKFGLPHSGRDGHEIFHNEKKHGSTHELEHKHYAHIK